MSAKRNNLRNKKETKEKNRIVAIVGPTASGKSELAVKLAKRFNGEIISADSRQVYRGMDIGTGKVPISYKPQSGESMKSSTSPFRRKGGVAMYKGIPHHLLDVANPKTIFTVADYERLGRTAIKKILAKGKVPIICGGTGLYADALLYKRDFPEVPPQKALRKKLERFPPETLFARLKKLDPRRARTIDCHNKRRLVRALEIVLTTGKPIPEAARTYDNPRYHALFLGISPSRKILHQKICSRLALRLKSGMVAEVRCLNRAGVGWNRLEELGLEYRYISRYLRGMLSKKEMAIQLEHEIERYAKRQITWFKRNPHIHWVKDQGQALRLADKFLAQ